MHTQTMSDDVCTNLSQGPENSSYFPNVAGNFLTISSKTGLISFFLNTEE